jgi:hypothetical protein
VIDKEIFPGKNASESPGVGTYTPKLATSIGVAAAAIARQAEKLQNLRRSSSAPNKASFANNISHQSTPGPGGYEPGKVLENKTRRVYAVSHSPFRSGSRRSLPWGGSGEGTPTSTRARKLDDIEGTAGSEPGPGEYVLAGAFDKAAQKPRAHAKGAVAAWTKGAPRFAKEPDAGKLTPSAVHYTPNYSICSGR